MALCAIGGGLLAGAGPMAAARVPDQPVAAADSQARFEQLWKGWKARQQSVRPMARRPRAAAPAPAPQRVKVNSTVGMRINPVLGKPMYHAGVDLAAGQGRPVNATADGIVTSAGRRGGYGLLVVVAHGGGYETRYAHLSQIVAVPGARVTRGTIIGRVGSTGRSTGPHLHYEVRHNGQVLDPLRFIAR